MSFTIQFMYNNEPMNKINKSPQSLFSLEGTLKDESSIVDPEILVEYGSPIAANYAHIYMFSRYYYITDITAVRTGLWRIKMHTDVLKTFSEGILGSPAIIAKSSQDFNLYLNDPDYKCQQNDIIITKTFPSGFNLEASRFVLTLFGDKTQTAPS